MILLKKLLRLNEEHLGEIKNEYGVYRNPKSIKRMDYDLRAISYPNGDLYVVDDGSNIIHSAFYEWLNKNGYKIPFSLGLKTGMVKGMKKGYISWQRKGSTNEFWLSESTDFDDPEFFDKEELMPYIEKFTKKVKSKNPKLTFVEITIKES